MNLLQNGDLVRSITSVKVDISKHLLSLLDWPKFLEYFEKTYLATVSNNRFKDPTDAPGRVRAYGQGIQLKIGTVKLV